MASYSFATISPFTDVKGEVFGTILKSFQSADIFYSYADVLTTAVYPVISDTNGLLESASLPLTSESGQTNFSGMTLTPIDLGAVRGYTAADFNAYYGHFQNSTMLEQGLPFENFLYDYLTQNFITGTNGYEDKMWNHPTAGIIAKLYAVSARTTTVTYSAMTPTTAQAIANSYFTRKQSILVGEFVELYVPAGDFENYVLSLQNNNSFDPAAFASNVKGNSYIHPGSGGKLKIYGFDKLNGKAFLTTPKNFAWGYASPNDWNAQQFVYGVESDKRIFRIHTKMATNVRVPEYVLRAV